MGRPLGMIVLVLVSGLTAIVMAYGVAATVGAPFVWRNVVLIALMLVTAIASLVNCIALWRSGAGALRTFVIWYVSLALTILSRHLYIRWEWTRLSTLVVEVGLIALIGIVLGRYVRGQLTISDLRSTIMQ